MTSRTLPMGPTVWTTLLLLLCGYTFSWLQRRKQKALDVPEVDCRAMTGNAERLQQSFEQYAKLDKVYKVRMAHHDILMLPPKLMTEIKSLPEDQVSFDQEVKIRFMGRHTGLGNLARGDSQVFVQTVGRDLTHHTGTVIAEMIDECKEFAIPHELGTSADWVTYPCLTKGTRIVALLTSRTFIGLPTCRDEAWLHVITAHTRNIFSAAMDLWDYPLLIRGLVAPFMRGIRRLAKDRREVAAFVKPRIESRIQVVGDSETGEVVPDDVMQWFMKNSPEKANNVDWHAAMQLNLSVASIHTTGMLLTNCMLDLAAYPQYQAILRDELLDLFNSEGSNVIRKQTMTKLKKLDSFIREVMRLNPISMTSVNRFVTAPKGITLSNGFHIPSKSFIAAPSAQVAMDPELWDEPKKFDGMRFHNLRQIPGNENKYQLVTANLENIVFGQGTHACPGRFFASNEIKLVLLYLVLNYDMKLEQGVTRPKSLDRGASLSPDPRAKVMFRKRECDVELMAAHE